ncbi:SPOR domain-containing protein [Bombella sp. TMW 2.2559]|uniref:SPOR domain-containing protein n=1 Tax=Bombella dulcis TaxID=2967339 RepID=A0ABT3W9X6_9PROT|nr:SPOR domain-containing protein [Bombella dulcis]MCX5615438.1 SPOR domain-containing protein [Bombella dulcis]
MSTPDDYRNSNVSPPHLGERLGGEGRRPLGRMAARESHGYAARPGFLASFMGSQSGTRGLMLLGVAGAALLLVVGGVWSWVVTHHPAGVPVIGPPPYPVKDRPEDPGGMMVMGDDTTKSDVTGKGAVHLAPPPEQPDAGLLARRMEQQHGAEAGSSAGEGQKAASPAAAPAGTPSVESSPASEQKASPDTGGVTEGATVSKEKDGAVEAEPLPPVQKQEEPKTPTESSEAEKAPEASGGHKLVAASPLVDMDEEEAKSYTRTLPPPTALPAPLEMTRKKSSESGSAGRYEVQLAALPNEELARQEWSRLRHRLPDLLGAYEPVYQKVERDGKVFVRLRVGSFADRAAARQLCVRLHAQAQACAVAAN